jgi:Stress responsive A/B Barrel Domain
MTPFQKRPVRHVVVFKFTADAAPSKIEAITAALSALQGSIPGIVSFEHGVNNSPEGKNLGFTHAFLITFEDAAARDAYLPHPEHKKFGVLLRSLDVLEDVFVVDYEPAS